MKITATSDRSLTLSAEGEGLELVTEGPPVSPYHFLAASLASCVFLVLESWATQAGRALSALVIDVRWVHDDEDRVESMELIILWPGLEDERRPTVRRLAAACPIHGTLHEGSAITVVVAGEEKDRREGGVR